MAGMDLARKMSEVFEELRGLDDAAALIRLDKRMAGESDRALVIELTITKAKLLASQGRWTEGVDLLRDCMMRSEAGEHVGYFAAEILVEAGRVPEATECLEIAEHRMDRSGTAYYKDCIFLLRAFCEVQLGRGEQAKRFLDRVSDPDASLFWLKVRPIISVESVRQISDVQSR